MPRIYPEIYVERGLTAAVKQVNARRKKKGKRPHGKSTTITVTDMEVLQFPLGRFFVRSSNLERIPMSKGWSRDALLRLDERCREGREAKGRVLWGVWERINETMTVAALSYHWIADGEIEITSFEATTEVGDKRALIEQIMITVAERIAIETSNGKKARLTWEVHRDHASRIKNKLKFTTAGKSNVKSRVILARVADEETLQQARASVAGYSS